jgi:hypothetical protein
MYQPMCTNCQVQPAHPDNTRCAPCHNAEVARRMPVNAKCVGCAAPVHAIGNATPRCDSCYEAYMAARFAGRQITAADVVAAWGGAR